MLFSLKYYKYYYNYYNNYYYFNSKYVTLVTGTWRWLWEAVELPFDVLGRCHGGFFRPSM